MMRMHEPVAGVWQRQADRKRRRGYFAWIGAKADRHRSGESAPVVEGRERGLALLKLPSRPLPLHAPWPCDRQWLAKVIAFPASTNISRGHHDRAMATAGYGSFS